MDLIAALAPPTRRFRDVKGVVGEEGVHVGSRQADAGHIAGFENSVGISTLCVVIWCVCVAEGWRARDDGARPRC